MKYQKLVSPDADLKRFVVFAGDDFYPLGGWDDLVASFDDAEMAVAWITAQERVMPLGDETAHETEYKSETVPVRWWQIVDLQTRKVVGSDSR